jgi:membrane protein DedA with SNARE-associated domain/rhodanese-related sulfurtransferase
MIEIDLEPIRAAIERDALWVVFANVLVQQLGLPVPVVPTLLVAGSLIAGPAQGALMLAAAAAASVVADALWYLAGRRFGYRVLSGLCRLSINPETCVTQTEGRFVRWGPWSLLVGKFIPGFSAVAAPIAGAMRMPPLRFVLAGGTGAALWAGSALLAGWLLRDELHVALAALSRHAWLMLAVLALAFALWLGRKLWRRHRFRRLAGMPRITVTELLAALASERPPLFLDLRGPAMVAESGPLEGATAASLDDLAEKAGHWPKDAPIVTLCACPEDATAVRAAQLLIERGYRRVLPLQGGYEAWLAARGGGASRP